MREFLGKVIFDSIEEVIRPEHSALLIVDLQRSSHTDVSCVNPHRDMTLVRKCIQPSLRLIDAGRKVGARVVWITNTPTPGSECPRASRIGLPSRFDRSPDDLTVSKSTANAFIGTSLDIALRQMGVKTTITMGLTTEGCVESTAEGAIHSDFHSVVASDCVASFDQELHEASLSILRARCDLLSSLEILSAWDHAVLSGQYVPHPMGTAS